MYWRGPDDGQTPLGRIQWVDVEGTSIADPVDLNPEGDPLSFQSFMVTNDGRFVVYWADANAHHVVDLAGDIPGPPLPLAETDDVDYAQLTLLSPDSQFAYYTYSEGYLGAGPESLWRVQLDTLGTSAPQLVSGPDPDAFDAMTDRWQSGDGRWVAYATWMEEGPTRMYLADVSGPELGLPVEVAPDLGDAAVDSGAFDPSGELVGFEVANFDQPRPLRIYATSAPDRMLAEIGPDVSSWLFMP